MSNAFSKEERVAFEQVLEGFEDGLVLSKAVSVYKTSASQMERSNNIIWRPQPYISQSSDGTDMTGNFGGVTQLSVPSQININKVVPWVMTANDLNDALQEGRLGDAAKQKLASDINVSIMNKAAATGTLVVKRTTAASGFDDIAQCEAIMNEQGVNKDGRYIALSTRDYNGMASNLSAREWFSGPVQTAYEKAVIPKDCGNFMPLKLDYANRIAAAAGTTVTINGANQYYTPAATRTASSTGETENVDNRYQNLAITVGGGTVAVGDCFTIADVYAVHHITKQSTGQLKTFRITAIITGSGGTGTVQISPPIISGGGSTNAELQYQNVDSTPASGAALVFLNTTAANINPFWVKDAFEIIPGGFVIPQDAGAAVMKASTSQGFQVQMMKQFDINTRKIFYRLDTFFGVNNLQPEMTGLILFSQS